MPESTTENARILRGIVMVMTAVAIFSVIDALSKYLTRFYPVMLIVWARYTFHLLFVIIALGPRMGLSLVRTSRPGAQFLRGLLLASSSILFVSALKYMPLAESTAIAFLSPLFITLMAVLFLKEKVELARWVAVFFGFVGVLTIIRPGSHVFTWAVLLPVGNSMCFASYQILTRRLAGLENSHTSIFYSGLIGTAVLSLTLPYVWVAPLNGLHLATFILLGILGGLGHLILIKAYDQAPASRLAPFSYSQLIWVTLIGFVVFNDFPDLWSIVGIAILVLSGIYTASHRRISGWLQREKPTHLPPGS